MTVVLSTWMAVVTAYCGYSGHLTASGTLPRPGVVAAARSVPFGTTLEIPGYGVGRVEDRGGAIGEGRLDIYYPDCWSAIQWGRQSVRVSVLGWSAVPTSEEEEEGE